MGNILDKPATSSILSNSKYNLKDFVELKDSLGNISSHQYSENPTDIIDEILHSEIDVSHFYSAPENSEFLNTFLRGIYDNIISEYLKDQWPETAFPLALEGCELREANLEKDESEDLQLSESLDLEEGVTVDSVYRGHTVYHFPPNTVSMPVSMKKVGLESCFMGNRDGKMVFVAPSEEPEMTSYIRMEWTCYILSNQSCLVSWDNAKGVLYDDRIIEQVNGVGYFDNLTKAYEQSVNNNSREMLLHVNKFRNQKAEMARQGEAMAYVGGEVDGEIVSLGDLMDRLELP